MVHGQDFREDQGPAKAALKIVPKVANDEPRLSPQVEVLVIHPSHDGVNHCKISKEQIQAQTNERARMTTIRGDRNERAWEARAGDKLEG